MRGKHQRTRLQELLIEFLTHRRPPPRAMSIAQSRSFALQALISFELFAQHVFVIFELAVKFGLATVVAFPDDHKGCIRDQGNKQQTAAKEESTPLPSTLL